MFDLTGKNALVTGASGAIGKAIAQTLASRGAKLAISGRNEGKLKALADELPAGAEVIVADLAGDVDALASETIKRLERVDILVNNAGMNRDKLLMMMDDEAWDDVMRVDLRAAFKLMRAFIRPMMKARWGRIVSIGSVVGAVGNAGQANYSAAKAGLVGLSKSLAREVAARNITVNVVAPGFIRSDMTDALTDQQRQGIIGQIPLGRVGDPADIAAAVTYLASTEAQYVTGGVLHVNGGMAMV